MAGCRERVNEGWRDRGIEDGMIDVWMEIMTNGWTSVWVKISIDGWKDGLVE
jgi:hypothetical protein